MKIKMRHLYRQCFIYYVLAFVWVFLIDSMMMMMVMKAMVHGLKIVEAMHIFDGNAIEK